MITYYMTRDSSLGGFASCSLDGLIDRLAPDDVGKPMTLRYATVRSDDVGKARLSSATLRYSAAVLYLDKSEWSAVDFVAGRYLWGTGLIASDDGYVIMTRKESRDWCANVRKDMRGGHSPFPCAAPSLARKLQALYDLCSGESETPSAPRAPNGKSEPTLESCVRSQWPTQAETVLGLIDGSIDPDTFKSVQDWARQCLHTPSKHARIACALNEAIEGHGVEAIFRRGYTRPSLEYINMGDAYSATLVCVDGTWRVSSYGDEIEQLEGDGISFE